MAISHYTIRPRHLIALGLDGRITHDGETTRVVLRQNLISVGCTDVTPDVLQKLLDEHAKRFCRDDPCHVYQSGQ